MNMSRIFSFTAFVIFIFAFSRGAQRVLTAQLLNDFSTLTLTSFTLVIASVFYAIFCIIRGFNVSNSKMWKDSIILGIANVAIPAVAFTACQIYITATAAALFAAAIPVAVAILAHFHLHEKINKMSLTGILLGLVGVVIVIISRGSGLSGSDSVLLGSILALCGVLSAASIYVFSRPLLRRYDAGPLLLPQLVYSAVAICLITSIFDHSSDFSSFHLTSFIFLTLLALVNYIIPQIAMFWLIQNTTALEAATPSYLAPLFAALLSVSILGQPLGIGTVLGGICIIAGAVFINRSKKTSSLQAIGAETEIET